VLVNDDDEDALLYDDCMIGVVVLVEVDGRVDEDIMSVHIV